MAIANNSEVEDLSDGEDNDPAVDEVILQDVDLMDEHPDFSPPDSSGDDSGEEYTPPDAAEDTDSENESQPNHPQVHRRGRKQQHIENDELDEEDQRHGELRPEPRNAGRGERWRSAPFRPNLVQFQDGDDGLKDERTGWQPLDYVEQYIDSDLMKLIADCTNAMSLGNTGRSLSTSVDEIYHFFGAAILMSCVPYPQIRMFWSNALQIPAISNTMSRDRFFKLRSHLKVVIDYDVSEDKRETDKFWKVRPFMDRILTGCRLQVRPECVSIDEQMIPFTGACPFRQYVPLKPNPVGMKNFVLASVDGLVLDFEVYQGSKTLASKVQDSDGLGLGTLVIKRLSETLTAGTQVYCDRFFTTIQAVDHMLKDDIYLTGTVMKGRVKQAMNKLPDDKTLKHQGRGAVATVTRADGKLCVVKWYDNKPVVMLSTVHSEQPEDTCQRWSKKGKKYVTVTRPSIVREYNSKMGGVDMSDRMMSYYRMSVRTKKWTIRMLMHFMDLALANSWLLYRRDNQENGTPRKSIMKFLEFRMVVAQVFLSKCDVLHEGAHVREEENENGHLPPPGKKSRVAPIPHISVRSSAAHLPEMVALKNPMRCRAQGCTGKSRVRCMTCNVHLCLQSERNCFAAFHTGQ
ncbi:piggyBac transposable element-derived protein 3-like isoform X1 [Megalobrama amblycephala]|uniref:piggyBac transposable element-derived protein 3-like isoform X1 n=1 Tax=Megalobrama amblycephala TaxID=75352 RepID=UPI002013EE07|nr:piggyBac transposable element-derived protein 3-like isoform X1 [Megalobrama amblycephala]